MWEFPKNDHQTLLVVNLWHFGRPMTSATNRWCCFHFGQGSTYDSTSIREKWPKMLELSHYSQGSLCWWCTWLLMWFGYNNHHVFATLQRKITLEWHMSYVPPPSSPSLVMIFHEELCFFKSMQNNGQRASQSIREYANELVGLTLHDQSCSPYGCLPIDNKLIRTQSHVSYIKLLRALLNGCLIFEFFHFSSYKIIAWNKII